MHAHAIGYPCYVLCCHTTAFALQILSCTYLLTKIGGYWSNQAPDKNVDSLFSVKVFSIHCLRFSRFLLSTMSVHGDYAVIKIRERL